MSTIMEEKKKGWQFYLETDISRMVVNNFEHIIFNSNNFGDNIFNGSHVRGKVCSRNLFIILLICLFFTLVVVLSVSLLD